MNKEDFVDEKPKEVDIEGRKFKIREVTGEECDEIIGKYIKVMDNERLDMDIKTKNREWLKTAVVDAPYEQNGKRFSELAPDVRVTLLQKLKANIRRKLIEKVSEINGIDAKTKKK